MARTRLYGLNDRDLGYFKGLIRLSGRSKQKPQQRRRRTAGFLKKDPTIGEEIFGILIASISSNQIIFASTGSSISAGFASRAVVPLKQSQNGSFQLTAEVIDIPPSSEDSDGSTDQVALDAYNPVWPMDITAGTGEEEFTSAESGSLGFDAIPVVVRGYKITRNLVDSDSDSDSDTGSDSDSGPTKIAFVITNVFLPVTLISGRTTTAVDGGDFDIDHIKLLWGRDPRPEIGSDGSEGSEGSEPDEQTEHITNPDFWDSDDEAYCVAVQLPNGSFLALDLACKVGT